MRKRKGKVRANRMRLKPTDFAISSGRDLPPSDLIRKATWKSMVSLPDDVSLRTSDHYGTELRIAWDLWGEWTCVGFALQENATAKTVSPMADIALNVGDAIQASVFNALTGFYRSAFANLRNIVENLTVGLQLELSNDYARYAEWIAGNQELHFGWAADLVAKQSKISRLEVDLRQRSGDDLFRQRQKTDAGGLMRRMFRHLSGFVHGSPSSTDGAIWQSNGPIFVPQAFEDWLKTFLMIYAFAVLSARLADNKLYGLAFKSKFTAQSMFQEVMRYIPSTVDGAELLRAIPVAVWE